ncbi:uroporphyrinogen-III C-methyltransferase [Ferrimonas sp. SCSIO 43195]|uniref:uroporphyrinogen-III C-methyltransferase n=1 Tax=Ferrimonas sp. SCSIO 43195 TaxID=2822844 RepID=UPI002074E017|nr:uroporphyrinogen-III C-methyltransferase [Ferrimonas sp. SCSIO 43195]USD37415.1 uroporphyrinogen-III C-methyltransferase [Ferrimonas sp. SCSIO 43195]
MDKKPEHPNSPSTDESKLDSPDTVDHNATPAQPQDDAPQQAPERDAAPEAAEPASEPSSETDSTPAPKAEHRPLSPPQPQPAKAESKGASIAILVAIVALLLAAASTAFTVWQWQQRQQQQLQSQALTGKLDEMRTQMLSERTMLEQRIGEQARQQQGMIKQVAELQSALTKARNLRPQDWLLAEADYLVQMAGRKLWLEQDVQTAIALLQDADRRLNLVDDNALTSIRGALKDDIATLKALPRQDLAGLALSIESLIAKVDQWPLNRVELPELAQAETSNAPSESVDDWRANLAKTWSALMDDFITVRRRQGELQPLLAPEQEWYLREHLKGKMMQAQLALYHGHTQAYRKALGTASEWIDTYFKRDAAEIDAALATLSELRSVELASRLPTELNSQPLLERIVADRLGSARENR